MTSAKASNVRAATIGESLLFPDVEALLKHGDALISTGVADLSRVKRLDSAGAALLLELSRRARAQGHDLHLRGLEPQLRRLLSFFAVDTLLQLDD